MELDIVSQLRDFSTLSFQRKLEIINKGRPTPDLKNLHQTAGKNKIIRCFQRSWYAKKEWLCGSSVKNRLFCFPCLLFAAKSHVWKKTGFCDLKICREAFVSMKILKTTFKVKLLEKPLETPELI